MYGSQNLHHRTLAFPSNQGFYFSCQVPGEKAMVPHSSTLAWRIPWTEEPGILQSLGSLGVRQDWVTSLSLFTFMHWRRKWQPTPVFLPGGSQGQRSLVDCHLWGRRVGHDWSDLAAAATECLRSLASWTKPLGFSGLTNDLGECSLQPHSQG